MGSAELLDVADRLAIEADEFDRRFSDGLTKLEDRANDIGQAWSGSNLGYQAKVYYDGLRPPPPGAYFSVEWGLMETSVRDTRGAWREMTFDAVRDEVLSIPEAAVLDQAKFPAEKLQKSCVEAQEEAESILTAASSDNRDRYLERLIQEIKAQRILSLAEIREGLVAIRGSIMSRDTVAMGQGVFLAPHQSVLVDVVWRRQAPVTARKIADVIRRAGSHLARVERNQSKRALVGTNVFIGHGRAAAWRELKDFVSDRLGLPYDEFNRVPVAGVTNIARLSEMLDAAAIALLVLTAEDEQADGKMRARENVVHEVGLFQGRLGFTKAIVLFEEGCEEFSNIQGLGQIRFPAGRISAAFEDVRMVLEREGLLEG